MILEEETIAKKNIKIDIEDPKNCFLSVRNHSNVEVFFAQFKTKKGCIRVEIDGEYHIMKEFDYDVNVELMNIKSFAKRYNCRDLHVIQKDDFLKKATLLLSISSKLE
ncbi:MAG: hypothetical protein JKY80_02060 [Mariprofundaceae bacterium]|nr:hypothetical protein [Methylophaga sp.]MBL4759625.1 hypothetical protein [Mariprofundaceae bacterium]